MLLNLYTGNVGRMLSMELVSAPLLHIDKDGRTTTETELRWGSQRDRIVMQGQLQVVGSNLLRETPKVIRSEALKLTLPALQSQRDVRITYHDDELLVVRDSRGIVDVLWRVKDESEASVEPKNSDYEGDAPVPAASQAVPQADGLLGKMEEVTQSLEALQKQSKEDEEARKRLAAEVSRLETALEGASVDARADSAKIDALAKIKAQVAEKSQAQGKKSEEQVKGRDELAAELASSQRRSNELETQVSRYHLQENSLRNQIKLLEQELITGARDAWPAYRAAVAKARDELKEVRAAQKAAEKEVSRLRETMAQKTAQLKRTSATAEAELMARQKLEAQLKTQLQLQEEASESLSKAAEVEKALRQELATVQEEMHRLEEREAASQKLAAEMEAEMKIVAEQVKAAKQAMKNLGAEKKRRVWPFR